MKSLVKAAMIASLALSSVSGANAQSWPATAMTMVFRVKDPAMLDQVKAGDKISFVAEAPNGQLTVTRLEKQH